MRPNWNAWKALGKWTKRTLFFCALTCLSWYGTKLVIKYCFPNPIAEAIAMRERVSAEPIDADSEMAVIDALIRSNKSGSELDKQNALSQFEKSKWSVTYWNWLLKTGLIRLCVDIFGILALVTGLIGVVKEKSNRLYIIMAGLIVGYILYKSIFAWWMSYFLHG